MHFFFYFAFVSIVLALGFLYKISSGQLKTTIISRQSPLLVSKFCLKSHPFIFYELVFITRADFFSLFSNKERQFNNFYVVILVQKICSLEKKGFFRSRSNAVQRLTKLIILFIQRSPVFSCDSRLNLNSNLAACGTSYLNPKIFKNF